MKVRRLTGENGTSRFWLAEDKNRLPNQIVSLGFLSSSLPERSISEALAASLCKESEVPVVLVRLEPLRAGRTVNEDPRCTLNGEFHMPHEFERVGEGFYQVNLELREEPPTPAGVASLIERLSVRFRHVLIQFPVDAGAADWAMELFTRSNLSYLFLGARTEEADHFAQLFRMVRSRSGERQMKPVVCLRPRENGEGFDATMQSVAGGNQALIRDCSDEPTALTGRFHADIRRLAREISGRLVGLALSSGAAKGFAHIGVIQVLEENGIEVDIVAGSSMGSYVGSLWAFGIEGGGLEKLAREMEARWAVWTLVDPVFPPRQGFLRGYAVKRRLMRTLGETTFNDLQKPLRVVAANLETLERTVFCSGQVAAAVHASSAVPGICVPVALNGETYVDGGIVDPLPVGVLREMGVSRVIAVDVIPTPDKIREALQMQQAVKVRARRRGIFRRTNPVNQQLNYFARGNLFEILMRSLQGAQIRVAEASSLEADVVLRPEIRDDRWLDYRTPGKFISLGREVAQRQLDEIKTLVTSREPSYEAEPDPDPLEAII